MIVRGISWQSLGGGVFMSPRFKRDLTCFVAGQRGNWHWEVERRSPPHFSPREIVSQGEVGTKFGAMAAVADALRRVAE